MKIEFSKSNFSVFNPSNNLKHIHMIDAGYHDHSKVAPFSLKPRTQFYHTFHIILEGKGTFFYKDKEYNLSPGSIFYIPAFERALYVPDKDDPYKFIWIGVEGDFLADYLNKSKGISSKKPIIHAKDFEKLQSIIYDFFSNLSQESTTEELLLSFFYSFLDCLPKKENNPNAKIDYVDKVKSFISINYSNPQFNISTISKLLHLSHSWLCALFKQKTGFSMQDYLIKVRLAKAREFLINENTPINEISSLCGFKDALYFSAAFKKFFGVSPKDFRKSNRV